ncbi:MAG: ABC transporter substrate-binding protein, partial [Alphaproteobacteria bacterium]|nr:ABC transporter substrate-binding protein [Alphaproteobacteria bacterium]
MLSVTKNRRGAVATAIFIGLAAVLSAPQIRAEETIKVGTLATLEGPFTTLGQDGMRGFNLALKEVNGMVAGKKIQVIQGSSDASPDSAVKAARKLVEQDGVSILIGPLSGDEGLAVKDYAKTKPNVTFINGSSAAQDTTLRDPAANFFRFSTEGAQWMSGLGDYVYTVKKYKNIVTLAEDYSFPYTQVFGFLAPYCKAGGKVAKRFWVPIGTKDFSSQIAAIPDNIDAIYVALGGADGINFLTQYQQAGGKAPLIGGSITADQSVLGSSGKARDFVIGMASAGPMADTDSSPAFVKFVSDYKAAFKDGFPSPSLFAHAYYINTKAALLALAKVNGDLSDKGVKFRAALS